MAERPRRNQEAEPVKGPDRETYKPVTFRELQDKRELQKTMEDVAANRIRREAKEKIEDERAQTAAEERKEALFVEKKDLLWEVINRENLEPIRERMEKQAEMPDKVKQELDSFLGKEIEDEWLKFGIKWFEDNIDDLRSEGLVVDNLADERKLELAFQKGAKKELIENEDYTEHKDKIEQLGALQQDFKLGHALPGSRSLALNMLNEKLVGIEKEISAETDESAKSAKQAEYDGIYETSKGLAQAITGQNLEKQAESQLQEPFTAKEDYIKEKLDAEVAQRKTGDIYELAKDLGYTIKPEGFWKWKKIAIYNENGIIKEIKQGLTADEQIREVLEQEMEKPEVIKKIKDRVAEELTEGLGQKWDEKNQERNLKNKAWQRERIAELAKAPENAEAGISELYAEVKDGVCVKLLEKELKTEEKTRGQIKAIEKEFKKGEKGNVAEFLAPIMKEEGAFEDPFGEGEEDMFDFFEEWGIPAPDNFSEENQEKMGALAFDYKEGKKSLIEIILELLGMFLFDDKAEKSKPKAKKKK